MYKLMIIDDDEFSRDVLNDTLEDDDYEISMARDGQEGLEKVRAEMPDLVLLDIDMPKMDGVAVLKALKEDPKTQNIPVIMVTAVNADAQIAMSLNIGAIDHVVKPYSSTVVRARVRAALRSADASKATAGSQHHGTIISFIGSKGGVGTTSVAYNVATDIARRNQSAILCELQPDGGTLSQEHGFSAEETIADLLEDPTVTIRSKDLDKCCLKQASGLRILVSAHAPDQFCSLTEEQTGQVLSGLTTMTDYVLCDLTHIALPSTVAALKQSDMVVLVLDLEPTALHAAEITYQRLRSLQISPSCIGAVVSTHTVASSSTNLKDVRETLSCPIMGVIPSDPDGFGFAAARGVPLVEAMPNSSAAGAISSLARRVEEKKLVPLQF